MIPFCESLVAKGKVKMIAYRRRKVFELGERSPVTDAEIVLLEVREQIRARRCRRRLKCTRTSAPAAGRPFPRSSPALARPPPVRSDPYYSLAVGGGGALV